MPTHIILLVEDNPDDAELATRAFQRCTVKNEVVVVEDGVLALEYLLGTGRYASESPSTPDLILLDLKVPPLDGLDVLRRIRDTRRTKHLPVVILTTSSEERDIALGYELGANSYVRKPIEFKQFVDVAQQIGSYWLSLNRRTTNRE